MRCGTVTKIDTSFVMLVIGTTTLLSSMPSYGSQIMGSYNLLINDLKGGDGSLRQGEQCDMLTGAEDCSSY